MKTLKNLIHILRWNLWWRGPLHTCYRRYLVSCGGNHHTGPYGPEGRYIVLMDEGQYHRYTHLARDVEEQDRTSGGRKYIHAEFLALAEKCFIAGCEAVDEAVTYHYALTRWSQSLVRQDLESECALPPPGWECTRNAGHDGPCAAIAKSEPN